MDSQPMTIILNLVFMAILSGVCWVIIANVERKRQEQWKRRMDGVGGHSGEEWVDIRDPMQVRDDRHHDGAEK